MKQLRRLVVMSIVLLASATMLFASGQGEAGGAAVNRTEAAPAKYYAPLGDVPVPSENYRIGVLVKTLINDFWLDLKNGYEDAAAEYGVEVEVFAAPTEGDLLLQQQILADMLAQDFDVICVSPITDTNLLSGLADATELGIPIVNVVDAHINPELEAQNTIDISTFIATDFVMHTETAMDFVAQDLGSEGGKVIHIMGLPGNPSAEQRKQGYLNGIENYSQLEDAGVFPGDWDRKKALDVATDVLQSQPDLRAIVGANDTMALGALQAVKNAGKLDEVTVVGVDAIPDAIRSITEGELKATVAFFQYQMAYTAIESAIQILEGTFDYDAHREITLGQEVWNQSNIDAKIEEYRDQYVGLEDF